MFYWESGSFFKSTETHVALYLASQVEKKRCPLLVILEDNRTIFSLETILKELIVPGSGIFVFPDWGDNYYEETPLSILSRRMEALLNLEKFIIILATPSSLSENLALAPDFCDSALSLKTGEEYDFNELGIYLSEIGYRPVKLVTQAGEFARRGGIIDIFPTNRTLPCRMEFFGDELESLRDFTPVDQRSCETLEMLKIYPALYFPRAEHVPREKLEKVRVRLNSQQIEKLNEMMELGGIHFSRLLAQRIMNPATLLDLISAPCFWLWQFPERILQSREFLNKADQAFYDRWQEYLILPEPSQLVFQPKIDALPGRKKNAEIKFYRYFEKENLNSSSTNRFIFTHAAPPQMNRDFIKLKQEIENWSEEKTTIISLGNCEVRDELVDELRRQGVACQLEPPGKERVWVFPWALNTGLVLKDFVILTSSEIFSQGSHHYSYTRKKGSRSVDVWEHFTDLNPGDFLVHIDHGVGVFNGIKTLKIKGRPSEYLDISYKGSDRLFVPVHQIDRIQKYIASQDKSPPVHALNSPVWTRKLKKSSKEIAQLAKQLLSLYSLRTIQGGYAFSHDSLMQKEMESQFPFEDTPGQLVAIEDVKSDMEKALPMDRLICGDVGYGKTEVAIRAAFKAVNDSKQVAVICPTTLLSRQHHETFWQRLSDFPVNTAILNRFLSEKKVTKLFDDISTGRVDVVIGTHRLLNKKISWKNLGLVIVDEEQKFGVKHKETLKELKTEVDYLTLTATPIPRTLHMALSGIRQVSIIDTPPLDRLPIKTYVGPWNEKLLKNAIKEELSRGGQVYYLFNRVKKIIEKEQELSQMLPGISIGIAHGQMRGEKLEAVMEDFLSKKFEILLCTTIIESGLDIANVNTLVVDGAERLGLAQLYQIRGRIGRSHRQAHAYLFYNEKNISAKGKMRLAAIEENTDLGSGYRIAMEDLEIRGCGNLLGAEQSGTINTIGFYLFNNLLAEEIRRLKTGEKKRFPLPELKSNIDAYFPEEYIPGRAQKLALYQRLTQIRELDILDDFAEELEDRFGKFEKSVKNLLQVMKIRILGSKLQVNSFKQEGEEMVVAFRSFEELSSESIARLPFSFGEKVFFKAEFPNCFFIRGFSSNSPGEGLIILQRILEFLL
ncbi:transcription-repair coupling factor [Candidatus Riflebacteria bacterium]